MLAVFSPIFMADTNFFFRYDFVAPLIVTITLYCDARFFVAHESFESIDLFTFLRKKSLLKDL